MATVRKFEELECWKLARRIHCLIGELIDKGALRGNYRLINQLEGSSGSIMDNIAEGFERGNKTEFILFLGYAKGSSGELRSQLYRLLDRKYISEPEFEVLFSYCKSVSGMIQKMIEYLKKTTYKGLRKKEP